MSNRRPDDTRERTCHVPVPIAVNRFCQKELGHESDDDGTESVGGDFMHEWQDSYGHITVTWPVGWPHG